MLSYILYKMSRGRSMSEIFKLLVDDVSQEAGFCEGKTNGFNSIEDWSSTSRRLQKS
jgi:hypothetical protein